MSSCERQCEDDGNNTIKLKIFENRNESYTTTHNHRTIRKIRSHFCYARLHALALPSTTVRIYLVATSLYRLMQQIGYEKKQKLLFPQIVLNSYQVDSLFWPSRRIFVLQLKNCFPVFSTHVHYRTKNCSCQ